MRILENKPQGKIYGLMGNIDITTNNSNYSIITDYKFNETVEEHLNSEKSISSLKMSMLDETYLNKKVDELSEMDIKKVSLASALIASKEYLIFDYFEKGLNNREKENFKRLFKKLTNEYGKTILIFTNDITFLWDIAEDITIVDNYGVINTISKENYFDIIDLINKPEVSQFIELMRKKGIKIENYKNVLDLLKAIYRLKEN